MTEETLMENISRFKRNILSNICPITNVPYPPHGLELALDVDYGADNAHWIWEAEQRKLKARTLKTKTPFEQAFNKFLDSIGT